MCVNMPIKPACKGDTESCLWSSCSRGVCALDGIFLRVPERCRGCGNLAYTVTCEVCTALDSATEIEART